MGGSLLPCILVLSGCVEVSVEFNTHSAFQCVLMFSSNFVFFSWSKLSEQLSSFLTIPPPPPFSFLSSFLFSSSLCLYLIFPSFTFFPFLLLHCLSLSLVLLLLLRCVASVRRTSGWGMSWPVLSSDCRTGNRRWSPWRSRTDTCSSCPPYANTTRRSHSWWRQTTYNHKYVFV